MVIFGILTFAFSFPIGVYALKRVWLSFTLASAFTVIYACLILLTRKRKKYKSKEDFERELLLKGKDGTNEILKTLYDKASEIEPQYFLDREKLVVNGIKYGGIGEEDVAQIYRKSQALDVKNAVVYMRRIDKNALALARSLPLKFDFFDLKKLYGEMKEKNLLTFAETTPRVRPKIKDVLQGVKNVPPKYFLFTAVTCALTSVFLPMKLYYLIVAGVNAIIGITIIALNYKT